MDVLSVAPHRGSDGFLHQQEGRVLRMPQMCPVCAEGTAVQVPAPRAGTTSIPCSQTVHRGLPSAWLWLDSAAVQSLPSLFPTFLTTWHLSFLSLMLSPLLHYSPSLLQGLLWIPLPTSPGFSPPGVMSGEECPSSFSPGAPFPHHTWILQLHDSSFSRSSASKQQHAGGDSKSQSESRILWMC